MDKDKLVILERMDTAGVRAVADELDIRTATAAAIHEEARDRIVVVSWPGHELFDLPSMKLTIVRPPNELRIEDLWHLYPEWGKIYAPDCVVKGIGGQSHGKLTLGDEVFAGDKIAFRTLLREELVFV